MSKIYYKEKRLNSHFRNVSLPPLKPIFLQTFDFTKLNISKKQKPEKINVAENETTELGFPQSVLNKIINLTLTGENKFTPSLLCKDSKNENTCNNDSILFDKLRDSFKKEKNKKIGKQKIHLRVNLNFSAMSNPSPNLCEVSLQTTEHDLIV